MHSIVTTTKYEIFWLVVSGVKKNFLNRVPAILRAFRAIVQSEFGSFFCGGSSCEIGLVTDFVTVSEVQETLKDVFKEHSVEAEVLDTKDWIEARRTYMKDLGQLFAGVSQSEFITGRHSVAKTFHLLPNACNLRGWVERNKENVDFRDKLGLR